MNIGKTITEAEFEDAVRYLESHNYSGPILWPISAGTWLLAEKVGLTIEGLAEHGIQVVMVDWVGKVMKRAAK